MRKIVAPAACLMLAAALVAFGPTGCKTDTMGVRSNHLSQYGEVAATPSQAADAAESVLNDMNFGKVQSRATSVDGQVTGYKADNTKVVVSIHSKGGQTSEISVKVGTVGQPALGTKIISKIKDKLSS